ncbi:MAG: ATP-dependent helicase, partial [Polyangiales bacterium]
QALVQPHRSLTVVGDDDQSIYRWRGADRSNILNFARAFPDAEVVKLEQNYRSTKRILRVAQAVIQCNQEREPKTLWTDNAEGSPVAVLCSVDDRDEAHLIAQAIAQLRAEGESLQEVGVLYRVHAQSRLLEEALRALDLPYRIVGGMRFFERAEIKDVLAYLRLVQWPDDDASVLRVLNVPARGIGKTSQERLLNTAAASAQSLWTTLQTLAEDSSVRGAGRRGMQAFVTLHGSLRAKLAEGCSLADLARAVIDESGYRQMLQADDTPESEARLMNLDEFVTSLVDFESEAPEATLVDFCERISLASEAEPEVGREQVTLMTVHAAKGLEFDHVFVCGLEDEVFPLRGRQEDDACEAMEEERRLAYVAFTRAREQLVLSWATLRRLYGQTRPMQPSRFFAEMPQSELMWLQEGRAAAPMASAADTWTPKDDAWNPSAATASSWGGGHGQPGTRRRGYASGNWARGGRLRPSAQSASATGDSYLDPSEANDLAPGLALGMWVQHPRFGRGQVVGLGASSPPRITVDFAEHGPRTIVARYLMPG